MGRDVGEKVGSPEVDGCEECSTEGEREIDGSLLGATVGLSVGVLGKCFKECVSERNCHVF